MTNLKRSKSMDFTLSSRSIALYPSYSELKTSKSYVNLKMGQNTKNFEMIFPNKSLIDTWVQEKNIEIRKTELQMIFLQDLQTHYSQQLDMVTEKNHYLSNELLSNANKLKMFQCEMNQETTLQKQLIDQLEIYKLLYNDLLVKNNTLHRNNQKLLSGNNVINNEQNLILQNQNNLYHGKIEDLSKLNILKKNLISEKLCLQNRLKCTEISWERELKKCMDDKVNSKIVFKNVFENYTTIIDNIKKIQESINNVLTIQDDQRQERECIINEIMQIEKVIQKRSQIMSITKETLKTLLEIIVDILKDF